MEHFQFSSCGTDKIFCLEKFPNTYKGENSTQAFKIASPNTVIFYLHLEIRTAAALTVE